MKYTGFLRIWQIFSDVRVIFTDNITVIDWFPFYYDYGKENSDAPCNRKAFLKHAFYLLTVQASCIQSFWYQLLVYHKFGVSISAIFLLSVR